MSEAELVESVATAMAQHYLGDPEAYLSDITLAQEIIAVVRNG